MKNHYSAFIILVFGFFSTVAFAQNPQLYINNTTSEPQRTVEGSPYEFTIALTSTNTSSVVVNVVTTNLTADASDYSSLTTTVTIPPGEISSGLLSILTANDVTVETDEDFKITATVISGNTSNTIADLEVTIIDNDLLPTLTIDPSPGLEGVYTSTVTLRLSNPCSTPIDIHFTTTPGTASAADYFGNMVPETLTMYPGQTWASFPIPVIDDALAEPEETYTLTATITSANVTNPIISLSVTVIDNDKLPTITMENWTSIEGDVLYATPVLDRVYNSDVIVHLVTTTGTAGADDYTSETADLTFSAGQNYAGQIAIATTDDALDEPRENFTVDGTVTSANTVNTTFSATMTIKDNDGLPDFELVGPGAIEEGTPADFYVTLTHPSPVDTVIQVTTTDGTAGNLDYTPTTETFTILAGLTEGQNTGHVPTIFDGFTETNETFTITGTVLSGNTLNTSDTVTVTLLDDDNVHAHYDTVSTVAGVSTTLPLLTNDTLHSLPVNASDVIITLNDVTGVFSVDAQGILTVPANAPIGVYQINYTLCEANTNPVICSTAPIAIEVKSPLKATYSLTYADSNGDGYTSVGDVISYIISLANIGNTPINNINLDSLFSNSSSGFFNVLGGPIALLNVEETDNTTFYATHILTQEDINLASNNPVVLAMIFKGTYDGNAVYGQAEYLETTSFIFSDGIKLTAFIDSNANGIQDETEVNFTLGHFNYEVNSDGVIHNLYTTPNYLYGSNPTTAYNLTYEIDSQYTGNYTCASYYPGVTVATSSGISTYNFPIIATAPYEDLSVDLLSYSAPPNPGFEFENYIVYTNNSIQTIASGTVTFTNDEAVSVIGEAGTTHTYTFTDLLPFESRVICVRLQTPTIPTVALGQLVTNTASITLTAGDINPINNTAAITQTIVGSWDPNDKTESHGGRILHSGFTANDYLTYTIRFENTGTANAINIKIKDILDAKLEPSSIKMLGASANYSLERIGTQLTWTFAGIDLPPSVEGDAVTGHGYVVFQVKPKPGFALGDIIPNTADIFFDFNPAIVTNTCTTEFVPFLGLNAFDTDTFEYYPNPTSGIVTFAMKNASKIDTFEVIDILGKSLISKTVHFNKAEIDFSSLKQGIYLVKLKANGQTKTVKITKN
jgi:uncharacterized repeat protein (TIGR01451 family)